MSQSDKGVASMRLCFFIASALFALHTSAQTQIRQMEGVTEYRLTNGLQILLAPNDLQPRTYVNLVVKAGSAVEGFGEGGMAHVLEHMVFKGTPTTRDALLAFAQRSLVASGTTNQDRTNYSASMHPDASNLDWYLSWLADAMFNSSILQNDLDKEMTVVRNEFERIKSDPGALLAEQRMALAFPNHGYGRPVIGNQTDIENISIEKLRSFYQTWYRTDNMAIVISGRFDPSRVLHVLNKLFGSIKQPTTALPQHYTREAIQMGVKGATVRKAGGQVITLIGWRGVPSAHPDDAALMTVAHVLANSAGGRFKLAAENQKWGSGTLAVHQGQAQYGSFSVALQVDDAAKLDNIQSLLLKQIDTLITTGITEIELERAKTQFFAVYENFKNNAETFGSFLAESVANGDWRLGFWQRENLTQLTTAKVQDAAKRYLLASNRVRVSYIPDAHAARADDAKPQSLGDFVATPMAIRQLQQQTALTRMGVTGKELDQHIIRSALKVGTKVALLPRPAMGDALQGVVRLHWVTWTL
jgi:zinc protease